MVTFRSASTDARLGVGQCRGLLEFLSNALCLALGLVGHAFLFGDLAIGQGAHQRFRWIDVADQGIHRTNVVFRERRGDCFLGLGLAQGAVLQKLDDVAALRRVAEVVADGRFEHLGDERAHIAEACDDLGCVVARDVDNLRHVEVELEAVGRTHGDGAQIRVENDALPSCPSPSSTRRSQWVH